MLIMNVALALTTIMGKSLVTVNSNNNITIKNNYSVRVNNDDGVINEYEHRSEPLQFDSQQLQQCNNP